MSHAHTTRYATLLGLVFALALTVVLMACGGDSTESGGEDRNPTRSQPADTGESAGEAEPSGPAATPVAEPNGTEEANPEPTREGILGIASQSAAEPEVTETGEPEPTREGIFGASSQCTAVPEATDEPTSVETDREALVALYNATNGPNWFGYDNWLSDAPLGEWFFVNTNADGRVTSLHLYGNELRGEIPPELGNLANLE